MLPSHPLAPSGSLAVIDWVFGDSSWRTWSPMIMAHTADTIQADQARLDRIAHTVAIRRPASRESGPTDGPRNRQGH